MAREKQSRSIDGVTYTVTQLPGRASLRTLARVARMFGPVANIAGGLVPAIVDTLRKLDLDDVVILAEELADGATVRASVVTRDRSHVDLPLDLDEHFAGKVGPMLEWIAFALEVNFAPFFADLARTMGEGAKSIKAAASAFRSTSESAGPASESLHPDDSETP
jgi:hypothetical protein